MDAQRWRQVDAVLDRALDADPAEWPDLLGEACAGDAELRREVEALLAEHGRHEAVLAGGAGDVAAALLGDAEDARDADRLLGARLGPWRVVRQIGHGGMARVFLGERADGEFAQRVAVKVLRAGLDAPADRARFRAERRILAALDHPNIARLLDGGVTPDGRPYLVLEYVEGEPLTAYCAARRLDVPARLRLVLQVADALEAAHRQLVVHRDLKPSNVLVCGDGRPRLLDFGIAKILDPALGGEATATRRRWLTPGYAAPEQFTGAPVTTATDVYQLGAVLYELLSGHHPFDAATTDPATLETRVLREDPPAPSRHAPALDGDLDAIVLKALRKEPAARYASVAELAADLGRVLEGEPVAARAGERAYRWRRWARRRAVPLALGASALAAAAGYAATLAVQNQRIARALAEATAARQHAETERRTAEQVTGFLLGLFRAADSRTVLGDTVTARTLLARGEARADSLAGQPAVQAAMLDVIGRVRLDLGALAAARPSLERALAIRRRALGEAHPDVAHSVAALGALATAEGRAAEAARAYAEAVARQRAALGDTASATQQSRLGLAAALHLSARVPEARRVFGEWRSVDTTRTLTRDAKADAEAAREWTQRGDFAYVSATARGAAPDDTAYARAEEAHREALAILHRLHGPRHVDVAAAQTQLAAVLARRGRVAESERYFATAVATLRAIGPAGQAALASSLMHHGMAVDGRGDSRAAVPLMREAMTLSRRTLADSNPTRASAVAAYGRTLLRAGDAAAAEPVLREAVGLSERLGGPQGLLAAQARLHLGLALGALGRADEGESLVAAAYADIAAGRAPAHRRVQSILPLIVRFYERMGRPADAARYRALLAPAPAGAGPR